MTTTTDIGNRALQLLGTRTTMASLVEQSNEATQINLCFIPIQSWCSGLANWNFARNTAVLTSLKAAGSPPWTGLYPSPGWNYEYALPADFVRAIYLTNGTTNTGTASAVAFIGEPRRFALAVDTIASVQQEVLLTNEFPIAILIYTAFITNPTAWPWYFERLMVLALAKTVCLALTGDKKLLAELGQDLEQQISVAIQANTIEGLMIPDATPEWIQALGINYPFRRLDDRSPPAQPQPAQRRGGSQ
jgi:hypothetical protein